MVTAAPAAPQIQTSPEPESDLQLSLVPQKPDRTNALSAMHAVKFRIPADHIAAAVADMPDPHRQAIKWFAGHCRERNFDKEQLATLLKKADGTYYSYDSCYQVLTGRRTEAGASIEPFIKAIENYRVIVEERAAQAHSGFIETRLSKMIWKVCRKALLRRRISFIFGDGQIGKSTALIEYQRLNNHGETVYVDMPTTGGHFVFLCALAKALGIPTQNNFKELTRRIFAAIDDRMLLILDNVHRCFRGTGERGLLTFDFIQELYDARGCGIVLSMTNEGRDNLRMGRHAKRLEQIWKRRLSPLQLPLVTPQDDLALFAEAYGLSPAHDEEITIQIDGMDEKTGEPRTIKHTANPLKLQRKVNESEGLGVWITILQDASDIAREMKRPMSWKAVIKAHCLSIAESEEVR